VSLESAKVPQNSGTKPRSEKLCDNPAHCGSILGGWNSDKLPGGFDGKISAEIGFAEI